MKVNQELLSNEPTHIHHCYGPVKIFSNTKVLDAAGREYYATAEILTGKDRGKWTTVFSHALLPSKSA